MHLQIGYYLIKWALEHNSEDFPIFISIDDSMTKKPKNSSHFEPVDWHYNHLGEGSPYSHGLRFIISRIQSRYIHNRHQRKARELRTSFGSFYYRLAQLYDKVEKRTVVPLRKSDFLPKYRQYTKEVTEAGIGSRVHLSYHWSSKEIARIREQAPSASASTTYLLGVDQRYIRNSPSCNSNFAYNHR